MIVVTMGRQNQAHAVERRLGRLQLLAIFLLQGHVASETGALQSIDQHFALPGVDQESLVADVHDAHTRLLRLRRKERREEQRSDQRTNA